jgi:hypothetical protein
MGKVELSRETPSKRVRKRAWASRWPRRLPELRIGQASDLVLQIDSLRRCWGREVGSANTAPRVATRSSTLARGGHTLGKGYDRAGHALRQALELIGFFERAELLHGAGGVGERHFVTWRKLGSG